MVLCRPDNALPAGTLLLLTVASVVTRVVVGPLDYNTCIYVDNV